MHKSCGGVDSRKTKEHMHDFVLIAAECYASYVQGLIQNYHRAGVSLEAASLFLQGRGPREDYIKIGVPLYEAAIKGDWKAAEPILDRQPDLIRFAITENYDTLLHIAASAESTKAVEEFVTNLVQLMERGDLELQNQNYNTAFSLAAAAGNVKTAMIMVEKNREVPDILGNNRTMPLYMAALFEKPLMVRYLYGISHKMGGDYWSHHNRGWVLQKCVEADIFVHTNLCINLYYFSHKSDSSVDVTIKIVNDRPELTYKKWLLNDIFITLAQKTDAFEGTKPNVVLRIIKSCMMWHDGLLGRGFLCFFAVFVAFHVKIGPREKESEALQLLRIIWERVARMPKYDIADILQGPRVWVQNKNKDKESEVMPLIRTILEKIDKGEAIPKSEIAKGYTTERRYPSRVLFLATRMGNMCFIIELIRSNPDLIWKQDDKGKTIFHLVVKHRQKTSTS
ncbi:putative ankyrin repeat-containing domain-containing protein [Helianthus anomalus]